jgi:hypothetical protein
MHSVFFLHLLEVGSTTEAANLEVAFVLTDTYYPVDWSMCPVESKRKSVIGCLW